MLTLLPAVILVLAVAADVYYVLPLMVGVPASVANTGSVTDGVKAIGDARAVLIQGLGGIILAAGLYFTARTFQLTRRGQ